MKLIMESWRKFLKEGISDVVYHYTSGLNKAARFLKRISLWRPADLPKRWRLN